MRKNAKAMIIISLILVTLVFVGLLKLGFWQLERAEQKRQYFKQIAKRTALPHQPMSRLIQRKAPDQELNQVPG